MYTDIYVDVDFERSNTPVSGKPLIANKEYSIIISTSVYIIVIHNILCEPVVVTPLKMSR